MMAFGKLFAIQKQSMRFTLLSILFIPFIGYSQTLDGLKELAIKEVKRIDMLDGVADSTIKMNTRAQTRRSQTAYFEQFKKINRNLLKAEKYGEEVKPMWHEWVYSLQHITIANSSYLSFYEQYFHMVDIVTECKDEQKEKEYFKNHVLFALDGIRYYLHKSYDKEVLLHAAKTKPYEVLTKFNAYSREPYVLQVLETVAKNDPNAIKQYFAGSHAINRTLKTSTDPVVLDLYQIFRQFGSGSYSYANLHLIHNKTLTLSESDKLTKNRLKWFKVLSKLRSEKEILGNYSVDKQLEEYSLDAIIKINLLHEKSDAVRFSSCANYTAQEMYTLMVYSQDEIFTSTYLGMFKRLLAKRKEKSMYRLMENMGFNQFRTFVQMAAGYNTLQELLATMTLEEQDLLMEHVVEDLDKTGGNLQPAVEVADIYGSLQSDTLKKVLSSKIKRELSRCVREKNDYGIRLYGLLYKLAGYDPIDITTPVYSFDVPDLMTVDGKELFPDGQNIQQHVFYDDEDGEAAFSLFLAHFGGDPNWKISRFTQYTLIQSTKGNKIKMYLNNPKFEYSANVVSAIFEKSGRYPDLLVHRGHSYYLNATVKRLTNNAKVAILGSCGGYHNMAKVLENASDAQIVSSKQIGTWTVNNVLIKDMSDQMRTGDGGIDWKVLWANLDKKLKNNDKWSDYVPPYKNLGMKFIKAFETL